LAQEFAAVVCLPLAAANHAANNLVVDAVLGAAGIRADVIADNLTDLLAEGPFVFIAGRAESC
jgi:hypothetical protein